MKVLLALVLAASVCDVAAAQTSTVAWQVSAGYTQWSFRDIARTQIPMDGSPIAMEGGGPTLIVRHERSHRARMRRLDVSVSHAGGLGYASPLGTVDLTGENAVSLVDARYQWRAYPFRDVLTSGLDFGIGLQGLVARRALTREYPSATFRATDWDLGVAGPLVARYRPGTKVDLEVAWNIGLSFTRSTQRHSSGTGVEDAYGGGGGIAELTARSAFAVSPQVQIVAIYERGQDWRFSSHRTYALRRTQLAMGVQYAY